MKENKEFDTVKECLANALLNYIKNIPEENMSDYLKSVKHNKSKDQFSVISEYAVYSILDSLESNNFIFIDDIIRDSINEIEND